jgi:O-antigen ligase
MNFRKNIDFFDMGNKFFLIGIFFLSSALPISGFFLLVSLVIAFSINKSSIFKDKMNILLFLSIGLIIFSTFNFSFIDRPNILSNYNVSYAWLNLFNWIPVFFLYWGFQIYLSSNQQRINFSKVLVSGCFPVILSFILQKYFELFGPFEALNGSIVWFQRMGQNGLSGLFSNPNYAGIWLALVLPFSLFLLQKSKFKISSRFVIILFCISISYGIFLTSSRNAFLGFFITILVLYGFRKFLLILVLSTSSFLTCDLILFSINGKTILKDFLSANSLIEKIINFNVSPRIEIWLSALSRIKERPIQGWGASTFPILHQEYNKAFFIPKEVFDAGHSHNMALELAHNFGIPLAILLITSIILLLFRTLKSIYFENKLHHNFLLNKAWLASALIIITSHLTDITYYDGKISILIGTLFAGLKCISNNQE